MNLWFAYPRQVSIALDQFLNALIPPFEGCLSWADETLSARCWRAYRDGRVVGRAVMPVFDLMFAWQRLDPSVVGEDGVPVRGHCQRAFWKEVQRRNEPPEYREAAAKQARAAK
jgi:hypothetical protein